MSRFRLAVGQRRDRGAVAVVVALCMVILMAAAALGMDIAKLAYERQALRAAVDAGAQAGSYALGESARAAALGRTTSQLAIEAAKDFTLASAPDLQLDRDQVHAETFCSVRVKPGTTSTPDPDQIPGICNPGTAWASGQAVSGCSGDVCVVPCKGAGAKCNTIKVSYTKQVDFAFGPVIGIPYGTTGTVNSAACNAPCGTGPNPMDIVVIADRTSSMNTGDVSKMRDGLLAMLETMTPSQQFVALGTIHKGGGVGASCPTKALTTPLADSYVLTKSSNKTYQGSWIATPFSNTYLKKNATTGVMERNPADVVVHAVTCLERDKGLYGTHLASAMKGAARYLLGYGTNAVVTRDGMKAYDPKDNLPSPSVDPRKDLGVPIRKVIVFETDGEPNEQFNSEIAALDYTKNSYDVSNTTNSKSCQNLLDIATKAKNAGVLIVTIGTGNASRSDNYCYGDRWTGKTTKAVLAAAASEASPGVPSVAGSCASTTDVQAENSDDDYFFCASDGDELRSVFQAVMGKLAKNTRIIKVPGVSD